MEKQLLKPYDKEYMKKAMLKHEEIFRQQVYELHRLYRIQKILMKRIDENRHNRERWDSRTVHQKPRRLGVDLEQPPEGEYTAESDGDGGIDQIDDESAIQLTLGPTSYYRSKKAESTPRTHTDSTPSFSSSSTGSSHIMKRKSSASTHHLHQLVADRRNEELTGHRWGLTVVSPDDDSSNLDFQNGGRRRRDSFDVEEEQLTQDTVLNQPSWLFRALSLNMTT